jgi:hypothetical protein
MATQVLVETNWVVDLVAPVLSRNRDAVPLHQRAQQGELRLHLPAICLIEARKVVVERKVRADLDLIRSFIKERRTENEIDEPAANASLDVLARFQQFVSNEQKQASSRIQKLGTDPVIDVFALDTAMLERSTALALDPEVQLKPYDLAILAAVLVRGAALHATGHEVAFCTMDGDLQPWNRQGRRPKLADEFDHAGVWVFGDFLMGSPARPRRS